MQFLINVGLARNDGKPDNTVLHTVLALNRAGFVLEVADVQESSTERTLCAAIQTWRGLGSPNHALTAVCKELAQDCIARASLHWTGRVVGDLVGPGADKWGKFDASLFIFPATVEYAQ